jgi:hypothetical protein
MKKISYSLLAIAMLLVIFNGCTSDSPQPSRSINFQFKFDSNQARLNNFGQSSTMPSDHAGQSPRFNSISAHYVELTPEANTPLGSGTILFKNEETTQGGNLAIDFSKSTITKEGEVFLKVDLSKIPVGTYKYIRVSLAYQNYDIDVLANGINLTGTIASFVGYNTFITSHTVKNSSITVNANKKQGYWAFESQFGTSQGQAPEGATTVPNPLVSTSPIPAGSCVATGEFTTPLIITGKEASDVNVTLSLSINKSFEWIEITRDGKFEPLAGETVVDMGLRGLVPAVK